jgi:hypothetical protein
MAVSPATIGVGVSLYALGWLAMQPRAMWSALWRTPLSRWLIAVAALGVASAWWAIDAVLALEKACKFAAVTLPLAWFAMAHHTPPAFRDVNARAFVGGCAIGGVLLSIQIFGDVLLRSALTGAWAVPAAIRNNVPAAAFAILVSLLPSSASRCLPVMAWHLDWLFSLAHLHSSWRARVRAFARWGSCCWCCWCMGSHRIC